MAMGDTRILLFEFLFVAISKAYTYDQSNAWFL